MSRWLSLVLLAIRSNSGSTTTANFSTMVVSGIARLVNSMSFETMESKTDPEDLTCR